MLIRTQKRLLGLVAIVGLIAVWWLWTVPALLRLPDDFHYSADVLSIDNLYDEAKKEYVGESQSVTRFSYAVEGTQNGVLLLKNLFDVRTVQGEKIFAVGRTYGIDPISRAHVPGFGDKTRDGYLFAPANLQEGAPFTYWHINYDGPAHMQFAEEETLFGLPVYRYETNYEGVRIDQTANLTSLPGVPTERGVELEPHLTLWVEPVTGYLVKYQDRTTAYFYDIHTKQRLHPWNTFTNTYTRASVMEHVRHAKQEKIFSVVVRNIVPLLAVLVVLALFAGFPKRRGVFVLLGGIFLIIGYSFLSTYTPFREEPVTIGIARWATDEDYDRNIQGFKDGLAHAGYIEGQNVLYHVENAETEEHRQREILRSFEEQHMDLIYSLTTPGTLITKELVKKTPVVFSIVTYPVEADVVPSLTHSRSNLVGTRNWVPVDVQLSVFRELVPSASTIGFLHRQGEPNSTVQLQQMKDVGAKMGITILEIAPQSLNEVQKSLDKVRGKIDALYEACDTLIQTGGEDKAIAFAKANRIPSFSCLASGVRKGDLIATVADFYEIGVLAGEKAARILDGMPPSALETNTVARPFIYINRTTADVLRIPIPQSLTARAKEIIQ